MENVQVEINLHLGIQKYLVMSVSNQRRVKGKVEESCWIITAHGQRNRIHSSNLRCGDLKSLPLRNLNFSIQRPSSPRGLNFNN